MHMWKYLELGIHVICAEVYEYASDLRLKV